MARITIVPTSHIARESILRIREAVERENPDCIAVELDPARYRALKEGEGSIAGALRALGPVTFLFYFVLRNIQQSLGRMVGVSPGSEMLEAARLGKERGAAVAFIDRDAGETFLRLRAVPVREKLGLLLFALKAAFFPPTAPDSPGRRAIDLVKVPDREIVQEALKALEKGFPGIHGVLVQERNAHMASRIGELSGRFSNIVAVVGAGHADALSGLVSDLQKGQAKEAYSYSVSYSGITAA